MHAQSLFALALRLGSRNAAAVLAKHAGNSQLDWPPQCRMIAYLHRYFVPHSAEQGYSLAIQVSCVVCKPLFVAGDAETWAAVQRAATAKPVAQNFASHIAHSC